MKYQAINRKNCDVCCKIIPITGDDGKEYKCYHTEPLPTKTISCGGIVGGTSEQYNIKSKIVSIIESYRETYLLPNMRLDFVKDDHFEEIAETIIKVLEL